MRFFYLLLLVIASFGLESKAQDVSWETKEWATDLKSTLQEFLTCGDLTPANTACNIFLAKALKRVYGIDDFIRPSEPRYLTANEIAAYVENSENWTLLGEANDQKVLNSAQGYANLGKAVIAVQYQNRGHGHVCMVIPGNLSPSGNWRLKCPNSASFFLNKLMKSYVGDKLSLAFSQPTNVKIYGRNF